ncbi:MAG: hypothetical protein ACFE9C_04660 [Candidatus Hodarchaeota archaeon]
MMKYDKDVKKSSSNEVIGKFFVLNAAQNNFIQGWIVIEKSLKQFIKDIKEEIDYEWDSEKVIIEKYSLYYIDTMKNSLIEIKDDKTLNSIRRDDKIFIVLLDKLIKFSKLEDIHLLHKWYFNNLSNYET